MNEYTVFDCDETLPAIAHGNELKEKLLFLALVKYKEKTAIHRTRLKRVPRNRLGYRPLASSYQ